jgi:hypothetical protein
MRQSNASARREHQPRLGPGRPLFGATDRGGRPLHARGDSRACRPQREQPEATVAGHPTPQTDQRQQGHSQAGRPLERPAPQKAEAHQRKQPVEEGHRKTMNSTERRENSARHVEPVQWVKAKEQFHLILQKICINAKPPPCVKREHGKADKSLERGVSAYAGSIGERQPSCEGRNLGARVELLISDRAAWPM